MGLKKKQKVILIGTVIYLSIWKVSKIENTKQIANIFILDEDEFNQNPDYIALDENENIIEMYVDYYSPY